MTEHIVRTGVVVVAGAIADLDDLPGASPNCPKCLLPMVAGVAGWDCEHTEVPRPPA